MNLFLGDNAVKLRSLLADALGGDSKVGNRAALEQSDVLRQHNVVVVDGLTAWTARDNNALWETDSFVILCGKLPLQPQIFAGIDHSGNARVTTGGTLVVPTPGLINDAPASVEVKKPLSMTWAVTAPGAQVVAALNSADGKSHPLVTCRGRVAYCAVSPTQVPEPVRGFLLAALRGWLIAERRRLGVTLGAADNISPSFAAIQGSIPATEKGPNARDYSYLLRRVTRLLSVLQRYTPHTDLHGKSVLDIGCGFGTTTVVSKAFTGFGSIQGIDIDQRLMDIGNKIARDHGLNMEFRVGDMLKLGEFRGMFDIVICNNAFNYFRSTDDIRRTLGQFFDVLKPGGSFITLTPSRMGAVEAFTKFPGMQFLPRREANQLIQADRLSYIDYGIIKLPSPFETHWWMRDTGFEGVQIVDAYTLRVDDVAALFKPRFYAVGTKPA